MRKLLCITDLSTHPAFDTTVSLYQLWSQHPGIALYHASAVEIASPDSVTCHLVEKIPSYDAFLKIESSSKSEYISISDFDLVFLRTDKPYPPMLLKTCSQWEDRVAFVNLASVTLALATRVFLHDIAKQFLPTSILTSVQGEAEDFAKGRSRFIVKKNLSYGGKGVFLIESTSNSVLLKNVMSDDMSFSDVSSALSHIWQQSEGPFEVCEYLNRATEGDKRILVVENEIYGAYIRRSAGNTWVNNISQGGWAELSDVLPHEEEIIRRTAPEYVSRGMKTLGYDFLKNDEGVWTLTEINAGNIGGYNRLEDLGVTGTISRFTDWLLQIPSKQTNRTAPSTGILQSQ